MTTREPAFYRSFRCLGGDCPLTCCRDWEIVLDEDSIADYQNAPGGLRQTIAENLVTDEEGDICFRLRPDGLCALLDGDGLCPIQRHWGEEHLCAHCGAYPRFNEEYGCLTENVQAISCPEAARLVMEESLFPLRITRDGVDDAPFDGVDPKLLAGLIATREQVFRLLNNRSAPLGRRLSVLLQFADDLQDCIDFGLSLLDCAMPEPLTGADPAGLRPLTARLLEELAGLDPLRPQWPELLKRREAELGQMSDEEYLSLCKEFHAAYPLWEIHAYLVFRHWPKVVNDDLLYGRAALTAAACMALGHLAMLAWQEDASFSPADEALLWANFSREIEHLDENFDTLVGEFYDKERWPLTEALGI